jgi:hypothetical protein
MHRPAGRRPTDVRGGTARIRNPRASSPASASSPGCAPGRTAGHGPTAPARRCRHAPLERPRRNPLTPAAQVNRQLAEHRRVPLDHRGRVAVAVLLSPLAVPPAMRVFPVPYGHHLSRPPPCNRTPHAPARAPRSALVSAATPRPLPAKTAAPTPERTRQGQSSARPDCRNRGSCHRT